MRLQSLAARIELGLNAGRLPLRLFNLYAGLVLFGVSVVLMIRAGLGLYPWDVFHQGIARQTGLTFGDSVILVSAVVLLLWFPLRQMPGIGTISNAIVIGLTADAVLPAVPTPGNLPLRLVFLFTGV